MVFDEENNDFHEECNCEKQEQEAFPYVKVDH